MSCIFFILLIFKTEHQLMNKYKLGLDKIWSNGIPDWKLKCEYEMWNLINSSHDGGTYYNSINTGTTLKWWSEFESLEGLLFYPLQYYIQVRVRSGIYSISWTFSILANPRSSTPRSWVRTRANNIYRSSPGFRPNGVHCFVDNLSAETWGKYFTHMVVSLNYWSHFLRKTSDLVEQTLGGEIDLEGYLGLWGSRVIAITWYFKLFDQAFYIIYSCQNSAANREALWPGR